MEKITRRITDFWLKFDNVEMAEAFTDAVSELKLPLTLQEFNGEDDKFCWVCYYITDSAPNEWKMYGADLKGAFDRAEEIYSNRIHSQEYYCFEGRYELIVKRSMMLRYSGCHINEVVTEMDNEMDNDCGYFKGTLHLGGENENVNRLAYEMAMRDYQKRVTEGTLKAFDVTTDIVKDMENQEYVFFFDCDRELESECSSKMMYDYTLSECIAYSVGWMSLKDYQFAFQWIGNNDCDMWGNHISEYANEKDMETYKANKDNILAHLPIRIYSPNK